MVGTRQPEALRALRYLACICWAEGCYWWHTFRWCWQGHCRIAAYGANGCLVDLGRVTHVWEPRPCRVFYQPSCPRPGER
jgi:hypothetical protein